MALNTRVGTPGLDLKLASEIQVNTQHKQANHGPASRNDHQPAAGNQPSVATLFALWIWLLRTGPKTPTTTPSLNPEQLWKTKTPALQTLEELGFKSRSMTQSSSQRLACSGGN